MAMIGRRGLIAGALSALGLRKGCRRMAMQPDQSEFFFVVIIAGGPGSGLFVYSPAPGLGNLVASIAATSGTDKYGNVYDAGVASYGSGGGNPVSQLLAGALNVGTPAQIAGAAGATPGGLSLLGSAGGIQLTSGLAGAGDVGAFLQFLSKTFSGVAQQQLIASAPIGLGVPVVPPVTPVGNPFIYADVTGGHALVRSSALGDSQTYNIERRSLSASGQTVNSVAFVPITGIGSFTLGVGTYRIHGKIFITTNVAGGAAELKFVSGGGIALSGEAWCRETKVPSGGGAVTWGQGNNISLSGATVFTSSALGAANTVIDVDGMKAVVTTAGTLTPQVAVTIAADTYTIVGDTYFQIEPVFA